MAKPLEQPCLNDCPGAFVTKLDPSGHTLLYSTFIGGLGPGGGAGGIAVTSAGTAVITGISSSNSFPQAGSLPSISQCPNGGSCYYLVSLKPDGSAFNYSGVLQAEQGTYGTLGEVATDAAGNAYLSGTTDLSSFPVTPGTLGSSVPGYPYDSTFVLKVDPSGKLLYSTIIPGTTPDNPAAHQIAHFNIACRDRAINRGANLLEVSQRLRMSQASLRSLRSHFAAAAGFGEVDLVIPGSCRLAPCMCSRRPSERP